MSVRSDVTSTPAPESPNAVAAIQKRRLNILPPGERERRRDRADRRRADRRTQNLGAPYGADRRSGRDDRQADRRDHSTRPAGISLMRDFFSSGTAPSAPSHFLVRTHD